MTKFTITCVGKHQHIVFRSPENYSADIIKNLYCPQCFKKAPAESIVIEIVGIPKYNGKYAIQWNKDILSKIDPNYNKNKYWIENFFGKRKLTFDFIFPSKRGLYKISSL